MHGAKPALGQCLAGVNFPFPFTLFVSFFLDSWKRCTVLELDFCKSALFLLPYSP